MLVRRAFNIEFYQEDMPDWAKSTGYDLSATLNSDASKEDLQKMLQNLLAERFDLRYRWEKREISGFVLGLERGRFKLKPSTSDLPPTFSANFAWPIARYKATRQPIWMLAGFISTVVETVVRNDTGIEGDFDYSLEFVPPQITNADTSVPSLFVVLKEQLGLNLSSSKVATDMFVLRDAKKIPTEN